MPIAAAFEFMDGQVFTGEMVRAFRPAHTEVDIVLDDGGNVESHPLKTLACIRMKPRKVPRVAPERCEVIETYGGNRYHVVPLETQRYQSGFFTVAAEPMEGYDLLFFTVDGVKSRHQQRPLGQILTSAGQLSESDLTRTLRLQKEMHQTPAPPNGATPRMPANRSESDRSRGPQRVGTILVEAGLVSQGQINEALVEQQQGRRQKIGQILIDQGLIDEDKLLSALAQINTPGRKIWTAEDPIEITQEGLRQVQVNPKIGFTFQAALRSFLRADPDVVMIGEMRDIETSKTAIEASLTGHLVFSTLHTNSAPETAVRLVEMGVDAFNFADAMVGILAQRLARRLCPACRVAHHPAREIFDEIIAAYGTEWFERHGLSGWTEETELMRPGGCERCSDTGFKGRLAVHELLAGWPEVKKAIKANQPVDEIAAMALEKGMHSLKMDGLQKVLAGHTTEAEIMKVCV